MTHRENKQTLFVIFSLLVLMSLPAAGLAQLYDVKAIETGFDFTVALKKDGKVLAWGDDYWGQLGDPIAQNYRTLPGLVPDMRGVVALNTERYYTLALKADGSVWGWGQNFGGNLCTGFLGNSYHTPVRAVDPNDPSGYLSDVVAFDAGSTRSMFLKEDGTVWAVGDNPNGELGTGGYGGPCGGYSYCTPVQVRDPSDSTGFLTGVAAVSTSGSSTLVRKPDGSVWGWGSGIALGIGTFNRQLSPVRMEDPTDPTGYMTGVIAIDGEAAYSIALKEDGSVWTAGSNGYACLGHGPQTTSHNALYPGRVEDPTDPTGYLTDVVAISAGTWTAVALKRDGSVVAWGRYVTGDGTTSDRYRPVRVVDVNDPTGYLTNVMSVSSAYQHTIVVKKDGSVWGWGDNSSGEVGDGTRTSRYSAVQVQMPTNLLEVVAPTTLSPGQEVTVTVQLFNIFNDTLVDTVVAVDFPGDFRYVSSTNDGVMRDDTDSYQVFWKLGNFESLEGGKLSVTVELPWGMAEGSSTIAGTVAARNLDSVIDVDDYLNYSPLKIVSDELLTQDLIDDVLATDPELNELYEYALSEGYEFHGTAEHAELNDGSWITLFVLLDKVNRVPVFLYRTGDAVVLEKFEGDAYTRFDQHGGYSVDLENLTMESWGTWAEEQSPSRVTCIINCFGPKIPYMALKQIFWAVGAVDAGIDCFKCFQFGDVTSCAQCTAALTLDNVPAVGPILTLTKCIGDCLGDPYSHFCTKDKKWCGTSIYGYLAGLDTVYIQECRPDGNYFPFYKRLPCSAPLKCFNGECIHPRDIECGGPCDPTTGRTVAVYRPRPVIIQPGRDPNAKSVDFQGGVIPGQTLTYTIEYENEGLGTAYNVFILDELDPNLDEASLVINDGGAYTDSIRLLEWFVGTVPPGGQGSVTFSVNVKDGLTNGTVITNHANVHFPSVPEITPTNPVVNVVRTIVADPQSVETISGSPVPITLAGRDIYGSSLTYSVTSDPLYGVLTGLPPDVTYTPEEAFVGQDTLHFVVDNGTEESEPARVSIEVNPNPADPTPPEVVRASPEPGAGDVPAGNTPAATNPDVFTPTVSAEFSEQIDPATLDESTFTVSGLVGTVYYDKQRKTALFNPSVPLASATVYTARITEEVTDLVGNPLAADYVWQFSTGSAVNLGVNLPGQADEIDFGDVFVNVAAPDQVVTLSSTGTDDLTITGVNLAATNSGDFLIGEDQCTNRTLARFETCTVRVGFTPTSQGMQVTALEVLSSDTDSPTTSVVVRGNGFSDEPPPIDCGDPEEDIPNGSWDCDGTLPGDTCGAVCEPGYELAAPATAICTETGDWERGGSPLCEIIDCGEPSAAIENGSWSCPAGTTVGETCSATCESGYESVQPATATCAETGGWETVGDPVCEPLAQEHSLQVIVDPVSGGIVTGDGISCPGACFGDFEQETEVVLTAEAADGYAFDSWTGCNVSAGAQCTVIMTSDKSVTARFEEEGCVVAQADFDADCDVDRDDLFVILANRNRPASVAPHCDLDGDGWISVLDARICVLQCTRPRCATN